MYTYVRVLCFLGWTSAVISQGYYYYPIPNHEHVFVTEYQGNLQTAEAICQLVPTGSAKIYGTIHFTQNGQQSPVEVFGAIDGLSPGKHGFHIHEYGRITNDCKDAGSHFNPLNKTHGGPKDDNRHAGDFGNIEADSNGSAAFHLMNNQASLQSNDPHYIIGKSIVVHEKEDDLGQGGNEESLKTGNAGARVACCAITSSPTYY